MEQMAQQAGEQPRYPYGPQTQPAPAAQPDTQQGAPAANAQQATQAAMANPQSVANQTASQAGIEPIFPHDKSRYNWQNLNAEMLSRLNNAYTAMPDNIKENFSKSINSGYRTAAEQAAIRARGIRPAAQPWGSYHQYGLAVDVDRGPANTWLHQNGQQFGLTGIHGDPPHIQMTGPHGQPGSWPPRGQPTTATQSSTGAGGTQQQMGFASPQEADAFRQKLGKIESDNNLNARTGNNYGIYQFSPDQFRQYGIINWRDKGQMDRALEIETPQNRQMFQNAFGRQPDGADLYLMHQQGKGAIPLLQNPNQPAAQVLAPYYGGARGAAAQIVRNGGTANMTAKQFTDMWRQKWGPDEPAQPQGPQQLPPRLDTPNQRQAMMPFMSGVPMPPDATVGIPGAQNHPFMGPQGELEDQGPYRPEPPLPAWPSQEPDARDEEGEGLLDEEGYPRPTPKRQRPLPIEPANPDYGRGVDQASLASRYGLDWV
jgi:hypothetical protein